jgi:Zn finger protein HypA/HybF involved in hydrogenase expression
MSSLTQPPQPVAQVVGRAASFASQNAKTIAQTHTVLDVDDRVSVCSCIQCGAGIDLEASFYKIVCRKCGSDMQIQRQEPGDVRSAVTV